MKFYNRISEICKNHKKVALFVDMDGTIVEYRVFPENFVTTETKEVFLNAEPLEVILKNLEKIKFSMPEIYGRLKDAKRKLESES